MKFTFIHARMPSDILDPGTTLGIEITDAAVSTRCGLGNIDGQHGLPGTYGPWVGLAAIEIAARGWPSNPLGRTLPSLTGYDTFATSRPDADAVGAMAVLVLDYLALSDAIDREIVATIAKADSFRPGGDWAPSPLPTEKNPWPSGASSVDSTKGIAHLGMICSPRKGDIGEELTLADRAFVMAWALVRDAYSVFDPHTALADRWACQDPIRSACGATTTYDPDYVLDQAHERVSQTRRALAREILRTDITALQLARGTYRADIRSQEQADSASRGGPSFGDRPLMGTDSSCDVAIVRITHAGALGLGYCMAPVVVAFDQANLGKVSIAAYDTKYLDVTGLKAELNRLESAAGGTPKWGGPPAMCSSPQNGGTLLADDVIVAAVVRFRRN